MFMDIFEGILQEERDSSSLEEAKEMVSSAEGVLLHASMSIKYPRGWLQSFPAVVCNSTICFQISVHWSTCMYVKRNRNFTKLNHILQNICKDRIKVCMHVCMYVCVCVNKTINWFGASQGRGISKSRKYFVMYVCMYVCMYNSGISKTRMVFILEYHKFTLFPILPSHDFSKWSLVKTRLLPPQTTSYIYLQPTLMIA